MDEVRLIKLGRLTASGLACDRPCLVYSICGIGVADATNLYRIYDGFNTSDDLIMSLVAVSYVADFRLFSPGLYFAKGIYVEFTTNGAEVFVQYLEVGR